MMESTFGLLLVIFCCVVSETTKLTDQDIRNNFNDVQTGMGVILRELLVVMDENERLTEKIRNTTSEFGKLRKRNKNTMKAVKRMLRVSKEDMLKTQERLRDNLTSSQHKMKKHLRKFVNNKYTFFSMMLYKLESQNKQQERLIQDLRDKNSLQNARADSLESELKTVRKRLHTCEKNARQNEEIMATRSREVKELKKSVAMILRRLNEDNIQLPNNVNNVNGGGVRKRIVLRSKAKTKQSSDDPKSSFPDSPIAGKTRIIRNRTLTL